MLKNIILLFIFWGVAHTAVLKTYFGLCAQRSIQVGTGDHMECWRLDPGLSHARQAPYTVDYLPHISLFGFFPSLALISTFLSLSLGILSSNPPLYMNSNLVSASVERHESYTNLQNVLFSFFPSFLSQSSGNEVYPNFCKSSLNLSSWFQDSFPLHWFFLTYLTLIFYFSFFSCFFHLDL